MKKRIDPKLPIPDPATASPVEKSVFAPDTIGDRLIRRLNELFKETDDGTLAIYDEGDYIGQADGLNFIGDAVTATASATLPTGIFDITVTVGAGAGTTLDTLSVTASEDVAAGDLINIWNSSGTAKGRKAKASAAGYEAFGWTDSAVSSGNTITVRFTGKNTHSSVLTPGPVFLSDTAGLATSTCPSGSGHVGQQVGAAESATSFAFEWQPAVLLAAAHTVYTSGMMVSVVITSSQTWTAPSGLTACWVDLYAGGGGGGGGTASFGGGGGGSGEYCQGMLIPIGGGSLVFVIGAGGAASSSGGNGNAGSNTSVNDGTTTWTVLGGGAGLATGTQGSGGGLRGGSTSGAAGTAESPFFFGGSAGGLGASTHAAGGGSAGRLTGGAGGTASNGGGGGGATPLGTGGAGGNNGLNNGSDAPTANSGAGGGGGGGGSGNTTGGAGAAGKAVIYYIA